MSDRTRRWLVFTIVAILAALLATFLGRWQYSRYEAKAENIARVEANFNSEPTSLDDLLSSGSFSDDDTWLPVEVTGHYAGEPIILPQRGVPGTAGDHVLNLFITSGDSPRTIVIDRGWYPIGNPPPSLQARTDEVTVVARARAAEPASSRGVRDLQVFNVDAGQVLEAQPPIATPNVQATFYLMAAEGEPGQEGLGSFPEPTEKLGNHLSYAFQWWVFAIGAFVGLAVVIRRDMQESAGTRVKTKRVSQDIEEEDALIDAQLSK